MKRTPLSREQSRAVDRIAMEEYGIPSIVLMENAGRGVVDVIESVELPAPVVVCCGKGNNAGDGYVIARHLAIRGVRVEVVELGAPEKLPDDAATNRAIVAKMDIPLRSCGEWIDQADDAAERLAALLSEAGAIVDALLGTGITGAPRAPFDFVIEAINRRDLPVVAVDLPSGVDCDTGDVAGAAIRAAHTCSFVGPKKGLVSSQAAPWVGQLHVVDIGTPPELLDRVLQGTDENDACRS